MKNKKVDPQKAIERANEWLKNAKEILCKEVFKNQSLKDSAGILYSFPTKGAFSPKFKVLGQAHDYSCIVEGEEEESGLKLIVVSPTLFSKEHYIEILGVIIHELIHIEVGVSEGHNAFFSSRMRAVGLDGPPTKTTVGKTLISFLETLKPRIGDVPQAKADKSLKPKQATRQVKMICECAVPRIIRVSRMVGRQGDITCLMCEHEFFFEDETNE